MVTGIRSIVLFVFLILFIQEGVGQVGGEAARANTPSTLSFPSSNMFFAGFDKLFNTYHWNGLLRYKNNDGPFHYSLNEQSLSTVILSDRKLIRDEHSFGLGLFQRFSERLGGALRESSYVLSDNQSVGINSAAAHAFYGGLDYRPFDRVALEPLVGYRFDNQIDQRDKGPSYMLGLLADDFDVSGYQT